MPYAVYGGDPGEGFTPTLRDETGAKAPAADIPAVAAASAAASAREKRRDRRRSVGPSRGTTATSTWIWMPTPTPDHRLRSRASPHRPAGAGPMGFTGTVAKGTAEAAGLTTLAGIPSAVDPSDPMLPGTWDSDDDSDPPNRKEENR